MDDAVMDEAVGLRRLRSAHGVVVNVDDDTAERLLSEGWRSAGEVETTGYAAMKVSDLKAEIERRNEGREEADLIPVEGKKADLVAALELDDDAARTEQ